MALAAYSTSVSRGGKENASKFVDALKACQPPGQCRRCQTLIIHPTSTTHEQLSGAEQVSAGVQPNLVRISVGIERHPGRPATGFRKVFAKELVG